MVQTKYDREALAMRTAEAVLNVIRDRGIRGLPLEDIYRQPCNRNLYLRAYGRLYSNQGAMNPGTTSETVDGMSLAKIDRIIDKLRHERYRWPRPWQPGTRPHAESCSDALEVSRGAVRWHTPAAETANSTRRSTASTILVRTQRPDSTAPRGRLRVVRSNGEHQLPPPAYPTGLWAQ